MRRSTVGRAFQTFQRQGPTGPRALLAAVIGRAAVDLAEGDRGAAAYFLSDLYQHHLELIGLSANYLPAGVEAADLLKLADARPTRRQHVAKRHILPHIAAD